MIHSFETEDARRYGIVAAVLLHNLRYWVEKNRANGRHRHEGRTWTYNSVRAFAQLFPYLTEKQIRTALDKLKEDGAILVGNFAKSGYNRTAWYAIVNEEELFGSIVVPDEDEETDVAEPPDPAPLVAKLDGNRGKRIRIGKSTYTTVNRWEFIENIRNAYPELRSPPQARKAIDLALERVKDEFGYSEYGAYSYLLSQTTKYATIRGDKLDYLKNPSTWFNNDCFSEDESLWYREVGKKPTTNGVTERGFFDE